MTSAITQTPVADQKFVRGLGLLDSTMLVAGSMIGSGIFIVSADIARLVGSAGWLLVVWAVTGVLTVVAALSYGELAAMMPRAGGQYVYLREAYSPLWGFLYGWTLFLVIQTGTIAAVAVAFARFLGVLTDAVSPTRWIVSPIASDLPFIGAVSAAGGALRMLIAICVGPVGSLFSSDAWNNITFTAGEVRDPRRNIPLSLFFGTALVITLYLLANVAYLCVLPLDKIQHAPDDRVGTAAMEVMFGGAGAGIMAV